MGTMLEGKPPVVVLAGGLGRRMSANDDVAGPVEKPLRLLAGRSLIDHVVSRIGPQAGALLVSTNPAASGAVSPTYAEFGLAVADDVVGGRAGPLAGILTGMRWSMRHCPDATHLVSVPADAPFLPLDLIGRLQLARAETGAQIVVARSYGRIHPTVALWLVALADDLETALIGERVRQVRSWAARYRLAELPFPVWTTVAGPVDPFFNVNTPPDLAEAERLCQALQADTRFLPKHSQEVRRPRV